LAKLCQSYVVVANSLVLEEAERSFHDALCVVRCLVKKKALIAGGGAPEIEVSQRLSEYAKTLKGMEAHCFEAFANALEVIPITLAENAGLNPINIVTELRNKHALGEKTAGINVKKRYYYKYSRRKCHTTFTCINQCNRAVCRDCKDVT